MRDSRFQERIENLKDDMLPIVTIILVKDHASDTDARNKIQML